MNNWESTKQEVSVEQGERAIITFKSTKELEIKSMKASCGCSTPNYNKKTKELIISVSTKGSFPKQVKDVWTKRLSVKIIYKNAPAEVLEFKVNIKKK